MERKAESPKAAWETRTKYAECGKIAIIMVGLPARGKSFVARNLARYLHWIGVRTGVVSLATIRKASLGDKLRAPFFDPSNKEALGKRTEIADKALNELISDFDEGGQVGILDASNTTEARRAYIQQILEQHDIKVIFLECLYSGEEHLVETHIQELRMTCPEYEDVTDQEAIADFKDRIQYYRPDYVKLSEGADQSISYIQILDGGIRITANQIAGFLPTKILFYLMNLGHYKRTIYLVQPSGVSNAKKLESIIAGKKLVVWSDVSEEAGRIAKELKATVRVRSTLSPLNPGKTEGLTAEQIRAAFPEDTCRHSLDPYHHRYPRAESYHDLVIRLEALIMELEHDEHSIMILADASVLRCIYAYYIEATPFLIPSLVLDPRQMIVLQPEAYGCHETRFDIESGSESLSKIFRQYTYLG